MYVCLDCEKIFFMPKKHIATHGLPTPPYEVWYGCPSCGGAYVQTKECDICGKWINGEYVKLKDGTVICDNCYEIKDITD